MPVPQDRSAFSGSFSRAFAVAAVIRVLDCELCALVCVWRGEGGGAAGGGAEADVQGSAKGPCVLVGLGTPTPGLRGTLPSGKRVLESEPGESGEDQLEAGGERGGSSAPLRCRSSWQNPQLSLSPARALSQFPFLLTGGIGVRVSSQSPPT